MQSMARDVQKVDGESVKRWIDEGVIKLQSNRLLSWYLASASDALFWKFIPWFAMCSCTSATFTLALLWLLEPFRLIDDCLCLFPRSFLDFPRFFILPICKPSGTVRNSAVPTSVPIAPSGLTPLVSGGFSPDSTRTETKRFPDSVFDIVRLLISPSIFRCTNMHLGIINLWIIRWLSLMLKCCGTVNEPEFFFFLNSGYSWRTHEMHCQGRLIPAGDSGNLPHCAFSPSSSSMQWAARSSPCNSSPFLFPHTACSTDQENDYRKTRMIRCASQGGFSAPHRDTAGTHRL